MLFAKVCEDLSSVLANPKGQKVMVLGVDRALNLVCPFVLETASVLHDMDSARW